ncbi:PREDICTED: pentatricopeptide repeat-containing protein At5g27110-like [Tarenaya hassleriana]|uniref:pentatricopeptide repeat-containing protein At5g27110-like n=1 Tax=Tarenaya hassleriana TaxID=28532 RepID=UPI00053CA338|nr:PREDICTED: pentatricopeptide repeat-containing protein At5g27110-like [Tarenaya hassleriana]
MLLSLYIYIYTYNLHFVQVEMDISTLSSLLRTCKNSKFLKQAHQRILALGLQTKVVICKSLINGYFSCKDHGSARHVFETLDNPLEISLWNSLMFGYTNNSMFHEALEVFGRLSQYPFRMADSYTYPKVLKACGAISKERYGRMVHGLLVRNGHLCDVVVASSLVGMYAKCNLFEWAVQMFDEMTERDVASWNTVISCCYQSGEAEKALELFGRMKGCGFEPNSVTLTLAISACSRILDLERGKEIHRECVNKGLVSDEYVSSALVDMYGKCGCLEMAREIFEHMPRKNVVAWNLMIQGYAPRGDSQSCIVLLNRMVIEETRPSETTLTSILMACSRSSNLRHGKFLHGYLIRNVVDADFFIECSLIDLYFKCSKVKLAETMFVNTQKTFVATWNVMISGYVGLGMWFEALAVYDKMAAAGVNPDVVTFTSVLPACSQLAALEKGKEIHLSINENKLERDELVMSALLDMYSKCGDLKEASRIFYCLPKKDTVSWTAMIAAYGSHGEATEALKLFDEMQRVGAKPDRVTFLAVLPACSQLAALEKGKEIHLSISENKLEIDELVMGALLDMYSKCGDVIEASRIFYDLPKKDVISWTAMIAAYGSHGKATEALKLFDEMQKLGAKPDRVTFLAVLSACGHGGLVDDGLKCFSQMRNEYGIIPGIEHYSCLIDLLGRAGRLPEAYEVLQENPEMRENARLLSTLFSACCLHHNHQLGEKIARLLVDKDPNDASNYIVLSNLYASGGRWDEVRQVRWKMKELGLQKKPGCSWIEIDRQVWPFFAEATSHPKAEKIYECLALLGDHTEETESFS